MTKPPDRMNGILPPHIKASIDLYVSHRIPTGGFLQAVLENNLREAFGRADELNRAAMGAIVKYLYNDIPSDCWGSAAKVEAWLHPTMPCEACAGRGRYETSRVNKWDGVEDVECVCGECNGSGRVPLEESEAA